MSHSTTILAVKAASAVEIGLAAFVLLCMCGSLHATDSQELKLKEVMAIEADSDYGEYLASECMTCHNATNADSNVPIIHGKEAPYLAEALLQYKNNTRDNETMRSVAGVLGTEEIAALIAYFSQQ